MARKALALFGSTLIVTVTLAVGPNVLYQSGTLSWDAPPAQYAVGAHKVYCGPTPGTYPHTKVVAMPATMVLISAVVPGPGQWHCVVTASNDAGESGYSSEIPFVAGVGVPPAPTGLVVQ